VQLALSRQRVRYDGSTYTLPLPDGPGKAAAADRASGPRAHPRSTWPPSVRRTCSSTGEIADGWLAIFYAPNHRDELFRAHRGGTGPRPARRSTGSTWWPTASMVIGEDIEACAAAVAGDGPAPLRRRNGQPRAETSTNALAVRMGYAEAAGRGAEPVTCPATTRVRRPPYRSSSSTRPALLGPAERIAERMAAFAASRGHHAGADPVPPPPLGRAAAGTDHFGGRPGEIRGERGEPARHCPPRWSRHLAATSSLVVQARHETCCKRSCTASVQGADRVSCRSRSTRHLRIRAGAVQLGRPRRAHSPL